MPDLTSTTMVARGSELVGTDVEDELMLLHLGRSTYYGLDRVGRRVWELIEAPTTVGALCAALEADFDVDAQTCRADVTAFVEHLARARLVDVR